MIHVRLGHLPQELAGERGKALHVTPLALRVERVEREGTLPGTGDAGQADELIAGQNQIDIAQIVLAGTLDDDIRGGHGMGGRNGRWRDGRILRGNPSF